MDTKMAGIIAPSQRSTGLPKQEQSLATRVLGEGGASGRGARFIGESRSSRHHGASDESELGRRILATHAAEELGIYAKPILDIIEVIFYRATADLPGYHQGSLGQSDFVANDEKLRSSSAALNDNVELPPRIISTISCEIFSKCSSKVDVNTVVMDILQLIKQYNWESKAVIVLVAFAITFGEFRLVVQLYPTNPLAKAVALIKQLPEVLAHTAAMRPTLEALFGLIDEIIDVTKKIVEFFDLPISKYLTAESPEIVAANSHIPIAVYWTIRSIVVASTQVFALTGMGIEHLTEPWELSSLAHKLNNIKARLVELIEACYSHIHREEEKKAFEVLGSILTATHIDNTKPLAALFHYNDGQPALYDCYTKRRVATEDLRRKIVALFITDLDPEVGRGSEYAILQQMYAEKKQQSLTRAESQYEVIWVPVADYWTEDKYRLFDNLRDNMEWHSIHHPSVVSPVVIKYIKEKWNFQKKPLLVVIDTQGRIVHHNAIHMMCIWGSQAYPFTTNREKLLWEGMTWNIDLLADNLEPNMNLWLQEGRHICLYGGEDIEWIRKFTRIAKDVAREANITLELLYVGRNKAKERAVRTVIDVIQKENLSRTLDWNLIWYFWMRLESMWHSKGLLTSEKMENVKNDPILVGIIATLSYGSSEQGWAVLSHGIGEMVKSNGEHMFKGLAEHGRWKPRATVIGFVPALREYLTQIHMDAPHHCTSLILPGTGAIPETVACAECGRLMERYTMYRCCTD